MTIFVEFHKNTTTINLPVHLNKKGRNCKPESTVSRWPAETVLYEEMSGEHRAALKPLITDVTAIQRLLITTVVLQHADSMNTHLCHITRVV